RLHVCTAAPPLTHLGWRTAGSRTSSTVTLLLSPATFDLVSMFKKLLQRRHSRSALSKLKFEARPADALHKQDEHVRAPRLPDEIILQILELLANHFLEQAEGYSFDRWWQVPDNYSAFFKSAGLVCKAWRDLTKEFQGPTQVPVIRFISPKAWKSTSGHPVHIDKLHLIDADSFINKKRSRLPKALPDCLLVASRFITSLSFEVALLRYPVLKAFLLDVASRSQRLAIYCDTSEERLSKKAFFWSDLFCQDGTHPTLEELALIGLVVYGGATADIRPCNARVITLEDSTFNFNDRNLNWQVLFPRTSRLTIARYCRYGALGISLTSPSSTLRSLDITWSKSYHPLSQEANILDSPNLIDLTIVLVSGSAMFPWQEEDSPMLRPFRNMPNIVDITVMGAAELLCINHLAVFCSEFISPTFCPNVRQVILSTERRNIRYAEEYGIVVREPVFTEEQCHQIAVGLEALEKRQPFVIATSKQPGRSIWICGRSKIRH
ncbi:hypothetical protein P389DRAFT_54546, partial [Cystobasidium minutum MCA 4210]|uniref:uncharacterized protein n=1 Tax=Cystobasidium minutum MCA 4210 TaxID=1397322 RepID=UPI0034CD26DC